MKALLRTLLSDLMAGSMATVSLAFVTMLTSLTAKAQALAHLDFLVTGGSVAAACPLGRGETELTVDRVMRNFGRFILNAEDLAVRSTNPADRFDDDEIQLAIQKLDLVIACAEAAVINPKGELIPTIARKLQGVELEKFLSEYTVFMKKFITEIKEFKQLFVDLLKVPDAGRDYSKLMPKSKQVNSVVDTAHDHYE